MKFLKKYSFLLFLGFGLVQAQEETKVTENKPFSVGLHYTGNFRNENIISDSYNGVVGLDTRYKIVSGKVLNLQCGLSIDYLKGRDLKQPGIEFNNAWFFNPNFGVEFNIKDSGFKPFFNTGVTFINYKYTISNSFTLFDPQDPAFNAREYKTNEKKSSITFQPGARFYFKKSIYLETSYKYLFVENNLNVHLFNLGLGINF